MTKRHRAKDEILDPAEMPEVAEEAEEAGEAGEAEASPDETPERELEEVRDRHLRLAAEYDNYRKRILRERAELKDRLQADLAKMMLDAIDDLSRVTAVDPASASAADVITGVELVERKVMKELEGIGLLRVGQVGEVFDPNQHEAVGADPAPEPDADGTIASVLQPGYRLGNLLVRPARVRVYMPADQD